MTTIQRIRDILIGICMILLAAMMIINAEVGFKLIASILCVALFMLGLRYVVFYFRMARYMVEGRITLYEGIIILDVSVLGLMLTDFPHSYLILYLMGIHAFSGVVDVLNALEARKLETPWKGKLLHGLINLFVAVSCVYFGFVKNDIDSVVYLYALGLLYSALNRIVGAFRRTAVVYIQ